MSKDRILSYLDSYFSPLIEKNGSSACGVGWNGDRSQLLRFEQLIKIITHGEDAFFSIADLGCGYGALLPFLQERFVSFQYTGYDICEAMIAAARAAKPSTKTVETAFIRSEIPLYTSDYLVASGIFNLKGTFSSEIWTEYIRQTLDTMNAYAAKAFSFNMLTSYSDADKMKDDLYYADPCVFFDWCKRRYSRNVAILHDYELYDFTILVRK